MRNCTLKFKTVSGSKYHYDNIDFDSIETSDVEKFYSVSLFTSNQIAPEKVEYISEKYLFDYLIQMLPSYERVSIQPEKI